MLDSIQERRCQRLLGGASSIKEWQLREKAPEGDRLGSPRGHPPPRELHSCEPHPHEPHATPLSRKLT